MIKKYIEQLKNKNEEAFKYIYSEYEKLIYYIALSITKDRTDAEEVVIDTFLTMYNKINTYQEKDKFKQWLMQIARNISINKVNRKKDKFIDYDNDYILNTKDDKTNNIDLILTIEGILDKVSSEIVILRIVYNLSFKEIAIYLNMTINQVQAMYYKAIKILKKELK